MALCLSGNVSLPYDLSAHISFAKDAMKFIDQLPWSLVIVGCLTLGLAPFAPPHVWEKLVMLSRGELVRPLDWFDLLYHAIPWLLLALKALPAMARKQ